MPAYSYSRVNDTSCGWSHITDKAPEFPRLTQDLEVDWVIIGSGFTGIAAAYRIAALRPQDSIVILDSEAAGTGASARNSGYIVDVTLNSGGTSLLDDQTQSAKSQLNLAGLNMLRKQVEEFDIDCDWDASGKFHCAADPSNIAKLEKFERYLERTEVPHKVWRKSALSERLGTSFYQYAVQTMKGVLVNPAALVNGLLANLPPTVSVYANSPVLDVQSGDRVSVRTPSSNVSASQAIVAVNALMPRLGFKKKQVFPLTLSASLTRPLSEKEYHNLGQPAPWGALSVSSMGATVRLTNDRRILVRNTVEWWPGLSMDEDKLALCRETNQNGLRRRFPSLDALKFEYTWSGNVCISRNSKPVFEKYERNIYLAGCYNAGGIAMGSLFGKLIVDHALDHDSDELRKVLARNGPNVLPPRPFFDIGLQTRLAWQRYQGRTER